MHRMLLFKTSFIRLGGCSKCPRGLSSSFFFSLPLSISLSPPAYLYVSSAKLAVVMHRRLGIELVLRVREGERGFVQRGGQGKCLLLSGTTDATSFIS